VTAKNPTTCIEMDLARLENGVAKTIRFRCRETESLSRTRRRSKKDEEVTEKNLKTERQKKGHNIGREEANTKKNVGKAAKKGQDRSNIRSSVVSLPDAGR
jgi:hypothetical protein